MVMSLKKQIDFYDEFKEWYFKIIKDFQFDMEMDIKAREELTRIFTIKEKNWDLEHILCLFKLMLRRESRIFIYGCGPSLVETIEFILKNRNEFYLNQSINLAADGASRYLLKKGIRPHAIFSDLDGISAQEFANTEFMVIHAHGDNIDKLLEFQQNILDKQNVIGTTQVEPNDILINSGGFTDGDRILFFIRSLLNPNQVIYFIGMDFEDEIGLYSKPFYEKNQNLNPIKAKKLKYAKELIEWISGKLKNEMYFINCPSIGKNSKKINLSKL
jgi:uncharacterized Rossmann fold enzyme